MWISASETGLLSRMYPYPDAIFVSDYILAIPTDKTIRAREEQHSDDVPEPHGRQGRLEIHIWFARPNGRRQGFSPEFL